MSKVRVLVGTRKGAFVLTSDGARSCRALGETYDLDASLYAVSPPITERVTISNSSWALLVQP
jgi:hypothetical protein